MRRLMPHFNGGQTTRCAGLPHDFVPDYGTATRRPPYRIVSMTTTSPLWVPTTCTFSGCFSMTYLFHFLLLFTISTILVLLGSSKRTYLPSGVNSPNEVVVV